MGVRSTVRSSFRSSFLAMEKRNVPFRSSFRSSFLREKNAHLMGKRV